MPGHEQDRAAEQQPDIFHDAAHPPGYDKVNDRVVGRCVRTLGTQVQSRGRFAHLSVADDGGFVASLIAYCAGFDHGFRAIDPERMPGSEEHFHRRFARLLAWRLNGRERLRRVQDRRQPQQPPVEELAETQPNPRTPLNSPSRMVRDWVNGIAARPAELPPRAARLEAAAAWFLHRSAGVPVALVAQVLHRDPSTVHRRLGALPEPCRDVHGNLGADDEYDELVTAYARKTVGLTSSERLRRLRAAIVYTLWRAEVSVHEIAAVLDCDRATVYRLRRQLTALGR